MKPLASAADAVRPAVARRSVLGSELQRAEADGRPLVITGPVASMSGGKDTGV